MIRLDQPRRWDLVSDQVMLSGIGTGFEATFAYRITEGHDEVSSFIMAGGGSGEHAQFQKVVDVSKADFKLDRLFVEVYEVSMKDGEELHKTTRPVLLGSRMVEGFYGYREHVIKEGDTLSSIARQHYGTNNWHPIHRANVVVEPDVLYPGEVLRVPVGT